MKKSLKIPRSRKSKNRRCNSQSKQGKRTNSDLQNITQKTKDRATLTTKTNRDEPMCSGISELAIFKRLSVLV